MVKGIQENSERRISEINADASRSPADRERDIEAERAQSDRALASVGSINTITEKCGFFDSPLGTESSRSEIQAAIDRSEGLTTPVQPEAVSAGDQSSRMTPGPSSENGSGIPADQLVSQDQINIAAALQQPNVRGYQAGEVTAQIDVPGFENEFGFIREAAAVHEVEMAETPSVPALAQAIQDDYYALNQNRGPAERLPVDPFVAGHGSAENGVRLGQGTPETHPMNFLNEGSVDYFRQATTDPETGQSMVGHCTLLSCSAGPRSEVAHWTDRLGASRVTSFTGPVAGATGPHLTNLETGRRVPIFRFTTPGTIVNATYR